MYASIGGPFRAAQGFFAGDEWQIFDIRSTRPIGLGKGSRSAFEKSVLRLDGNYFAAQGEGGIVLTDVRKKEVLGTFVMDVSFRARIAFLGADRIVGVVSKGIRIWTVPVGNPVKQIPLVQRIREAEGPGISPAGKYLAIRSKNVYVIIEATTGKIAGRLTDDNIYSASFHPDGELFAAVTQVGGYFHTKFADLMVGI